MRLLLIEDDDTVLDDIRSTAARLNVASLDFTLVGNRDDAISKLKNEYFDFVVCDLRIPSMARSPDAQTTHGLAVLSAITQHAPGTPSAILSAHTSDADLIPDVREYLTLGSREDAFGDGSSYPLAQAFDKGDYDPFVLAMGPVAERIRLLDDIRMSSGINHLELSWAEKRVLRLFARRMGGSFVRVQSTTGGLSGARSLRAVVEDEHRVPVARVLAKVAPLDLIGGEQERYNRYVSPRLLNGDYAVLVNTVEAGAGNYGGLFYRLAEGFDQSAFGAIVSGISQSLLVAGIRQIVTRWASHPVPITSRVGDIRERLINDVAFAGVSSQLTSIDVAAVESIVVRGLETCQHGDLHGENVLTNPQGIPILIDFNRVGPSIASLDAVTLELSLLFRPEAQALRGSWPTHEQARRWFELEAFAAGPLARFVSSCREWAYDAAGGDDYAVPAVAYAYAVRQLQFPDTDHALAVAIIESASEAILRLDASR